MALEDALSRRQEDSAHPSNDTLQLTTQQLGPELEVTLIREKEGVKSEQGGGGGMWGAGGRLGNGRSKNHTLLFAAHSQFILLLPPCNQCLLLSVTCPILPPCVAAALALRLDAPGMDLEAEVTQLLAAWAQQEAATGNAAGSGGFGFGGSVKDGPGGRIGHPWQLCADEPTAPAAAATYRCVNLQGWGAFTSRRVRGADQPAGKGRLPLQPGC